MKVPVYLIIKRMFRTVLRDVYCFIFLRNENGNNLAIVEKLLKENPTNIVLYGFEKAKGDWCIIFSLFDEFCKIHKDSKIYLCIPKINPDIISFFSFQGNVEIVYLDYVLNRQKRKYNRLNKKYGNRLYYASANYFYELKYDKQYKNILDVTAHECFRMDRPSQLVYPTIPNRDKNEKLALSLKEKYGKYIFINSKTPSLKLPNDSKFFEKVCSRLKEKMPEFTLLSNMDELEGATAIKSSIEEMYFIIKHAVVFIGLRSGANDISIGTNTPQVIINCLSFTNNGISYTFEEYYKLNQFDTDTKLLEIAYETKKENDIIDNVIVFVESL